MTQDMTNKIQDREKYNQVPVRCRQDAGSWLTRCRLFLSALLMVMATGAAW